MKNLFMFMAWLALIGGPARAGSHDSSEKPKPKREAVEILPPPQVEEPTPAAPGERRSELPPKIEILPPPVTEPPAGLEKLRADVPPPVEVAPQPPVAGGASSLEKRWEDEQLALMKQLGGSIDDIMKYLTPPKFTSDRQKLDWDRGLREALEESAPKVEQEISRFLRDVPSMSPPVKEKYLELVGKQREMWKARDTAVEEHRKTVAPDPRVQAALLKQEVYGTGGTFIDLLKKVESSPPPGFKLTPQERAAFFSLPSAESVRVVGYAMARYDRGTGLRSQPRDTAEMRADTRPWQERIRSQRVADRAKGYEKQGDSPQGARQRAESAELMPPAEERVKPSWSVVRQVGEYRHSFPTPGLRVPAARGK